MNNTVATTPVDLIRDALERTGSRPRRNGKDWAARCPAHDDHNPSLTFGQGRNGDAVLHCHAGCDPTEILAALHLEPRDLFAAPLEPVTKPQVVARYTYTDEDGTILYVINRREPGDNGERKTFRATYPNGKTGRRVIYRLPDVLAAVRTGETVYVVEGEKDADRLADIGYTATTSVFGAGKWRDEYAASLMGGTVVIIADRDEAGVSHAQQVAESLRKVGCATRIVQAAVTTAKADVSDHLDAGHTLEQLVPLEPADATAGSGEAELLTRTVTARAADGMKLRAPRWLYDRRMPTDSISLLAGREGIGKSTIAFDIVARVTRGELPGRYVGTPRGVGVIASEDSWESVILPRLMAARADLTRVYRVEARTEDNKPDTVSTPADITELARVCGEHDIALLILDPVMSVIHGSLDTHKDREVRQALDPLVRFCAEKEVAVLGLIHVNKSGTSDPLNSIMASRAFTAVARSVLYCIADPECETEDRFLFGHPKSNLGPRQPTIGYRLIECRLEIADVEDPRDAVIVTSRVAWGDEDDRSIRDAMEPPKAERPTGELAHQVIDWMTAHGRSASAGDIATGFPMVKRNTLDQNLARMVKRGQLERPAHGLYSLPKPSDTQSDTSLETSSMSYMSEPSERKINMTGLTELTDLQVSEPLSERPSGWADSLYEREA